MQDLTNPSENSLALYMSADAHGILRGKRESRTLGLGMHAWGAGH